MSGVLQRIILKNRRVILFSRLILAATFFVSSFGKLVDIRRYSVALVYNMDILPGPLAVVFGWVLPFVELACALGLLFGVLTRLSALGVGLLSISFLVTKIIPPVPGYGYRLRLLRGGGENDGLLEHLSRSRRPSAVGSGLLVISGGSSLGIPRLEAE